MPIYRSKKLLKFTRHRMPVLSGKGETVYHHVKMLKGGGTSLKPPDSHVLPVADEIHHKLDSPGHSERSVFDEYGYNEKDVKALIINNLCAYLEEHNIDSEMLIIDLLTDYLSREEI